MDNSKKINSDSQVKRQTKLEFALSLISSFSINYNRSKILSKISYSIPEWSPAQHNMFCVYVDTRTEHFTIYTVSQSRQSPDASHRINICTLELPLPGLRIDLGPVREWWDRDGEEWVDQVRRASVSHQSRWRPARLPPKLDKSQCLTSSWGPWSCPPYL